MFRIHHVSNQDIRHSNVLTSLRERTVVSKRLKGGDERGEDRSKQGWPTGDEQGSGCIDLFSPGIKSLELPPS